MTTQTQTHTPDWNAVGPELLAALRAACRDADFGLEDGDAFPSWYEPAVAAIARATAEQ